MGNILNTSIYFTKFWKGFSPILAIIYLLGWVLQFVNKNIFLIFDRIFGFFPNLLNDILYIEFNWQNSTGTMGYVYVAGLLIISTILVIKIEKGLLAIKYEKQKKAKKQKNNEIKASKDKGFCGLFELKINYLNSSDVIQDDLEKLKIEYSKMFLKKMKEKFPNIKFANGEKLFFFSDKFSIINNFIKSVLQIYRIFEEINRQKNIETSFLLSFADIYEINNTKFLFKLLLKMNEMNNLNKIVVFDKFRKKYSLEDIREFEYEAIDDIKIELEKDVCFEGEYGFFEKK